MSVVSLIKFLSNSSAIPVKNTCMNCILSLYESSCLDYDSTWTVLLTSGKKLYLSDQGFNIIVDQVKVLGQGGRAVPLSLVKEK